MSAPPLMGARWCETHGRRECTRRKHGGEACHANALEGMDSCKTHVGKTLTIAKAEGQARLAATAWRIADEAGNPLEGQTIDPAVAMLRLLTMQWIRVNLYAELVRQQVERDGLDATPRADNDHPLHPDGAAGEGAPTGLVGHTYSQLGEFGTFAASEQLRALVVLEGQERDRLARYAKDAHSMGIADREIALTEQQGSILGHAVRRILHAMFDALVAALGEVEAGRVVVERMWPELVAEIAPREIRAALGDVSA